jgi:HD-GYP domain-containing protein (c-di-GMP phosphodiesterase class II)
VEHVLVVESEAVVRATLARVLGRAGYRVHLAADPEEAALLGREVPDLAVVIADGRLAGDAGRESFARLRASHPRVRSIMIAGQAAFVGDRPLRPAPADAAALRRLGLDDAVARPFEVFSLAARVAELAAELIHDRARGAMLEQLREDVVTMVDSLAMALEARDPYTHGHSLRVADYALMIADGLGLSARETQNLKHGAALHDIGKIAVRQEVLHKPGRLSDEEFEHIKIHPSVGREILEPIEDFKTMLDVVYYHHERIDGRGYPEGLKGNKIPELAQIVAVADTYDAMTSDRPYRRGMEPHKAFAVMGEVAGSQLNAEFVSLLSQRILPRVEAPHAPAAQRAS